MWQICSGWGYYLPNRYELDIPGLYFKVLCKLGSCFFCIYDQNINAHNKATRQKDYFVPVEIVEEWQEVESQFAPAFFLTERQDVSIHDGCWVVESWTAHHRSAHIPSSQ